MKVINCLAILMLPGCSIEYNTTTVRGQVASVYKGISFPFCDYYASVRMIQGQSSIWDLGLDINFLAEITPYVGKNVIMQYEMINGGGPCDHGKIISIKEVK